MAVVNDDQRRNLVYVEVLGEPGVLLDRDADDPESIVVSVPLKHLGEEPVDAAAAAACSACEVEEVGPRGFFGRLLHLDPLGRSMTARREGS